MGSVANGAPRNAVLIDSRGEPSLAPLIESRPLALLPVGGKPLLQFWCEQLNQAGFTDIHLLLTHFPEQIRQLVGEGERWGVSIRITIAPEESDSEQLRRLASPMIDGLTLVASLDRLPALPLTDTLAQAISASSSQPVAESLDRERYDAIALFDRDNWLAMLNGKDCSYQPFAAGAVFGITTPNALWQANQALLRKEIYDPLPPGFESDPGIELEIGVQLRPGIRFEAPCSVGRNTLIMPRCQVGPATVIGANCIINDASTIRESVVFDHTVVGSHTALERVIADGRLIYNIDHEVATWIDDPAIIDSNRIPPPSIGLFERLLALILLLLLSLPLLLFAFRRSLSGSKVLTEESISLYRGRDLGGEPYFETTRLQSLSTEHNGWRRVPWLVAVLRGQLQLVGVSSEPQAGDSPPPTPPEWAREVASQLPGVVTLHALVGNEGSGSESRFINDSYYLATRSLTGDLQLLGRWLIRLVTLK
jgi:NDP-sugar pyrophosphorylase family protein